MSFADAFLTNRRNESVEDRVAEHVDRLMQSVAPETAVSSELPNVQASNLCFGIPMNWALNDANRQAQVRRMLKDRLQRFEPRLQQIRGVEMSEDAGENLVEFSVAARLADGTQFTDIELQTSVSLFDQQVASGDR